MKKNKSEIIVEFGVSENPSSKIDSLTPVFDAWIKDPERISEGIYDVMVSSCGLAFTDSGTAWNGSFNIFSDTLENLDWQTEKIIEFIKEKFSDDWKTIYVHSWAFHDFQTHEREEVKEINSDG